jgi:hypothetical protein
MVFDQSLNPGENGLNTKQLDYNLGIGGLYSFSPKEHYNVFVSLSGFNLTRSNVSFYEGQENRLHSRIAAFVGGEVLIKGSWSMLPSALFQKQGPQYRNNVWKLCKIWFSEKQKRTYGHQFWYVVQS